MWRSLLLSHFSQTPPALRDGSSWRVTKSTTYQNVKVQLALAIDTHFKGWTPLNTIKDNEAHKIEYNCILIGLRFAKFVSAASPSVVSAAIHLAPGNKGAVSSCGLGIALPRVQMVYGYFCTATRRLLCRASLFKTLTILGANYMILSSRYGLAWYFD